MTRDEARELLPIIKAFSEGKAIQFKGEHEWFDAVNSLSFDNGSSNYRVKPITKYRPFNNAEECWNEMLKHKPFGVVKDKNSLSFRAFTFLNNSVCNFVGYEETPFDEALNDIEFADGTPFGIKEEK